MVATPDRTAEVLARVDTILTTLITLSAEHGLFVDHVAVSGDAHVFVDTFDRFTAWARLLGATSLDAWTSRDRVTILVKGRVDGIDITVFGELPHLPGLGEKTERFPLAVLDTVTGAEMAVAA